MSRSWTFGLTLLALSVLAPPVFAQASNPPTAHLAFVDGRVVVEHDTTAEDGIGDTPLSPGDRVRTEDGRAEILTEEGSVIDLDEQTTIDLQSTGLYRLIAGRLVVVSSGSTALQVDTPAGAVFINEPGEYRIGIVDDEGRATLDVAVVRGRAEIASDVERETVETGQRAWARVGEAPSYPVAFNSAQSDAFYDWAFERGTSRRGTTSAQYVPASLTQYAGTFENNGSWNYEPSYGYVWYPRVAAGWRPYYSGRWRHYGGWGWTWTGGDAWAWPTHHYGRWGISTAGLWFWIPGSVWAGAWVDWQFSSSYVSWCPLGYNNYPVYGWYGGYYGHGGGHGHGWGGYHAGYRDDCWRGWTVVSRDHFGGYRGVNHVAVDGRRLAVDRSGGPAFSHGTPPRPVAVPRGSSQDGFFADRGQSGFRNDGRGTQTRGGMAVPRNGYASSGGDRAASLNSPRAIPRGGTITRGDTGRVYHVPPAVGESTRDGKGNGVDRFGGASASRGYAAPRTDGSSRTWGAGTYSGVGRIAPGTGTAVPRGESRTLPDQRFDRSAVPGYQRQPGATYERSQPGYQRQPLPPTYERAPMPRQAPSVERTPTQRQGSASYERAPRPGYQRQATPSYDRAPSTTYRQQPGATYERSPMPSYQRQTTPSYQRMPTPSYQRPPSATYERSPTPSFQRQPNPSFERSPALSYQRQGGSFERAPSFQRQAPSFERAPTVQRQAPSVERAAPQPRGGGQSRGGGGNAGSRGGSPPQGGGGGHHRR